MGGKKTLFPYLIKLDEDAFTFNSSPQISRPS